MNTTEMVSVPRERALQLINLLAEVARTAHWLADNSEDCGDEGIDCQRVDFEALSDALDKCEELPELPDSVYVRDGWLRAADELRALLAQSSEQYQVEPVGYQQRTMTDRPGSQWTPWRECCDATRARYSQEVGQFNQHGIMREIRPVFASAADPGEVEQLSRIIRDLNDERDEIGADAGRLRAQLAERDALLHDLVQANREYFPEEECPPQHPGLMARYAALSASAEPSAPLPPVDGDLLPPIGSKVLFHLGREDEWVEHTVVGYYVWGNHGLDQNVHRVFVRARDADGYLNARLLSNLRAALERKP